MNEKKILFRALLLQFAQVTQILSPGNWHSPWISQVLKTKLNVPLKPSRSPFYAVIWLPNTLREGDSSIHWHGSLAAFYFIFLKDRINANTVILNVIYNLLFL